MLIFIYPPPFFFYLFFILTPTSRFFLVILWNKTNISYIYSFISVYCTDIKWKPSIWNLLQTGKLVLLTYLSISHIYNFCDQDMNHIKDILLLNHDKCVFFFFPHVHLFMFTHKLMSVFMFVPGWCRWTRGIWAKLVQLKQHSSWSAQDFQTALWER